MELKGEVEGGNAGGPVEDVAAGLVGQIVQAMRDL